MVDPQRLVDEVLAFFEASAEEQEVRLEGSAGGRLSGDADLLRQALANLVGDALHATPRGGQVQGTAPSGPQGAEVRVRDTGRGIPAAELPYVCDRFARTRASLDERPWARGWGWPSSIPSPACTGAPGGSKANRAGAPPCACCCRTEAVAGPTQLQCQAPAVRRPTEAHTASAFCYFRREPRHPLNGWGEPRPVRG